MILSYRFSAIAHIRTHIPFRGRISRIKIIKVKTTHVNENSGTAMYASEANSRSGATTAMYATAANPSSGAISPLWGVWGVKPLLNLLVGDSVVVESEGWQSQR